MNSRVLLSIIFSIISYAYCFSAPPPPAGGPGCWPPPCVPIDGGISFLIIAGAVYGGKKLYDKSKDNKSAL